jgi:hypothetical protein
MTSLVVAMLGLLEVGDRVGAGSRHDERAEIFQTVCAAAHG